MKIFIVGCNGLLGQNLLTTLFTTPGLVKSSDVTTWRVHGAGIEIEPSIPQYLASYRNLDITKRHDLEKAIAEIAPDFILNAAAITDVDLCEREKGLCALINRDAVGWMAESKIPMVQISSDYVFNGENGPYREDDAKGPLSYYGLTKLESESLALAHSDKSIVVRTMTLWGKDVGIKVKDSEPNRKKTSFVDFVRNSILAGKEIRIVTDQFGNPTLAEDLALSIWHLILKKCSGIYHVVGSEWNSRFEWAEAIADYYQLDKSLIKPCLTADLKQLALRPLKSGLYIDKLVQATGFKPRDVAAQIQRIEGL